MKKRIFIYFILFLFFIFYTKVNNVICKGRAISNINDEFYESIVNIYSLEYDYEMLLNDIETLSEKYPSQLEEEVIGKSYLGREIKCIIFGNKDAKNKLLIIGNAHARETHNTPLIMKQIEYYCENWENEYNGEKVKDIFKNSAIFFVPTQNPDGLELVINGFESIPDNKIQELRAQIVLALERKIKNNFVEGADSDKKIDISNYKFKEDDLTMWKSNIKGVDLHYNFYEENINEEELLGWKNNGTSRLVDETFSSENYIGPYGCSESETEAIINLINKYDLTQYSISYHGRGPTIYWNYNTSPEHLERYEKIVKDISQISKSPYSTKNSLPVGFAGWYQKKYNGFSVVIEVGWSKFPSGDNAQIEVDACPLKDEQFKYIWEAQKDVPIMIVQKYINNENRLK